MAGDLTAARLGIVEILRPILEPEGWHVRPYVRANPAPPELALGIPTLVRYGATLAGGASVSIPLVAITGMADDEKAQQRADWFMHADGPVLAALRGARPAGVQGQLRVASSANPRIVGTDKGDVLLVDAALEFIC